MKKKIKYIVISGIDGSGKTSVINELQKTLENQGYSVSYIWMRYNHYTVKCMNAFARLLGISVKVHNAMGDVWEHRLYKMPWFCKIYIRCSLFDNWIARRKVLRLKTDFVICDRWVNDILIDLGAEGRIMNILDSKWYERFHAILPANTSQFVINRNIDEVLNCRVENNTNPDFQNRFDLYKRLMEKSNVCVIDNTGTIENSVGQIINALS